MNWNHEHAWARTLFEPGSLDENVRDKPTYPNSCGHPDDSFVGSILAYGQPCEWVDVYLFEEKHDDGVAQKICIRYGENPAEYLSVGTVLDLLISSAAYDSSGIHRAAAALIDAKFKIRAERLEAIGFDEAFGL